MSLLCRAGGGLESLISVLKALVASDNKDLRRAVLSVLLAMSVDEGTRGAVASLGLVPVLVQLLGAKDDPVSSLLPQPSCLTAHNFLLYCYGQRPTCCSLVTDDTTPIWCRIKSKINARTEAEQRTHKCGSSVSHGIGAHTSSLGLDLFKIWLKMHSFHLNNRCVWSCQRG